MGRYQGDNIAVWPNLGSEPHERSNKIDLALFTRQLALEGLIRVAYNPPF